MLIYFYIYIIKQDLNFIIKPYFTPFPPFQFGTRSNFRVNKLGSITSTPVSVSGQALNLESCEEIRVKLSQIRKQLI